MEKTILVTYASKYGATREIAEKIGEGLSLAGLGVDVLPVTSVRQVDQYRAVIMGSAIYIGKWQKDAEVFLKENEARLAKRPVWLFSSGPSGEGNPLDLVDGALLPSNLKPIVERIKPKEVTIFHGNIDLGKINGMEKFAVKNVVKKPFGDYRDWNMIKNWTNQIAASLKDNQALN